MWYHLHLIPLQQGTEVPTASWPAYEDGHFFIKLASGSDDAHLPSPASQPLQILFRTGTYFVRQGGSDSTVRINGKPISPGADAPLLQSDLIEFGCTQARKYNPSLTCRIDLGCSPSPLPAFPGPYTHITSNMKFTSICFDDVGRALDDSARHYGYKSPCPPLRPAALSFADCTVINSSPLPRRDDAPLPAFFPHVPTSPVSTSNPSYEVIIGFAPRVGSSSAPVSASPPSLSLAPSSACSTSVLTSVLSPSPYVDALPTTSSSIPSTSPIITSISIAPSPTASSSEDPTSSSQPSASPSPPLTSRSAAAVSTASAAVSTSSSADDILSSVIPSSHPFSIRPSVSEGASSLRGLTMDSTSSSAVSPGSPCPSSSSTIPSASNVALHSTSDSASASFGLPYGDLLQQLHRSSSPALDPAAAFSPQPSSAPDSISATAAPYRPPLASDDSSSPIPPTATRSSSSTVDIALARIRSAWMLLRRQVMSETGSADRTMLRGRAGDASVPFPPGQAQRSACVLSVDLALQRVSAALRSSSAMRLQQSTSEKVTSQPREELPSRIARPVGRRFPAELAFSLSAQSSVPDRSAHYPIASMPSRPYTSFLPTGVWAADKQNLETLAPTASPTFIPNTASRSFPDASLSIRLPVTRRPMPACGPFPPCPASELHWAPGIVRLAALLDSFRFGTQGLSYACFFPGPGSHPLPPHCIPVLF
ncbi:hypothetical protein CF319_g8953 [Tilletia indica]|nr:hypothetical protein CF319_g8953 [Tilletia indica]